VGSVTVRYEVAGAVVTITIDRQQVRNAVNAETAEQLGSCFRRFAEDKNLSAAVLTGAGNTFCVGFDLKAVAAGAPNRLLEEGDGPMGPTRLELDKPVIAAIEGFAVAGGLELALWCDLRVAASDATFGVFNRRFGVPLIDLGTIRLPRLVGHGRAADLILTGRPVHADEALAIGLVNRLVAPATAVTEAQQLARRLSELPQRALRADLQSLRRQGSLSRDEAMDAEFRGGKEVIDSGEAQDGARRFVEGSGRHGT
jgi:enoyl-CoA hydratase